MELSQKRESKVTCDEKFLKFVFQFYPALEPPKNLTLPQNLVISA
jgi:hypothetical protein